MKLLVQIAGIITVFSSFSFAFGQRQIDIKPSILDEVKASCWIKTPEDFNLKGNIKQEVTTTNNLADTTLVVQFNENGHLIYEKTQNLLSKYSFDATVLKKVNLFSLNYHGNSQILLFNANGQLESKEIINKSEEELRKITVAYSYKKGWKKISLDYNYSYDISHWDVVLGDEYTIEFDSLDRVSVIYSKSRHPETTYGATKHYGYSPQSGKLTNVSFTDDKAGSNSALSLHYNIQYNDKDSTFIESMTDFTVRNSLWSYSYSILKKLNRFGEVVVLKNSETNTPYLNLPVNESISEDNTTPPKISYSIDSQGNWTERVAVLPSGEKVITRHLIEYY